MTDELPPAPTRCGDTPIISRAGLDRAVRIPLNYHPDARREHFAKMARRAFADRDPAAAYGALTTVGFHEGLLPALHVIADTPVKECDWPNCQTAAEDEVTCNDLLRVLEGDESGRAYPDQRRRCHCQQTVFDYDIPDEWTEVS